MYDRSVWVYFFATLAAAIVILVLVSGGFRFPAEEDDELVVVAKEICGGAEQKCGNVLLNRTSGVMYFLDYSTMSAVAANDTLIAKIVFEEVNEIRTAQGLKPLSSDARLENIADEHSEDMAERNFYDHVNPDGRGPSERADAAGFNCVKNDGGFVYTGIGENIHITYTHELEYVVLPPGSAFYRWLDDTDISKQLVQDWWESPEHRENIVDPLYDRTGVGIAVEGGKVYATQDFC